VNDLLRFGRRRFGWPLMFELPFEVGDLGFELKDASDARKGHTIASHAGHLLDAANLDAGVAPLATVGATGERKTIREHSPRRLGGIERMAPETRSHASARNAISTKRRPPSPGIINTSVPLVVSRA